MLTVTRDPGKSSCRRRAVLIPTMPHPTTRKCRDFEWEAVIVASLLLTGIKTSRMDYILSLDAGSGCGSAYIKYVGLLITLTQMDSADNLALDVQDGFL